MGQMMVIGNEKQLRVEVCLHTPLFLEHPSHGYENYGSPLVHSAASVYNCRKLFFIHLYPENFGFLHTIYQLLDFRILRHIKVLHASQLNLCLQQKKPTKK